MSRFLPLSVVEKYEPLAEELGVSSVARSQRGFLTAYKRAKTSGNLSPEWHAKREAFIKRHMAQVAMRNEDLFDEDGNPSRRHLALIMWAYSPGLRENPEEGGADDWVTIAECSCYSCTARDNPRKKATGNFADLDTIVPVVEEALQKHGLTMDRVSVAFTRGGKSAAGVCSYSRSLHECKIKLNGLVWPAFNEEQRLNTILHEAAHAIQFLTTRTSDHGPVWQKIAKSIGCTGDRCLSVEASQTLLDAYNEAKGLPKRPILTRESAAEASHGFKVGDYVSFEHKRETWRGKIVEKGPYHAKVMIQHPHPGITGKIPYPQLQIEAPPPFAAKVPGVDKPLPGESLSAWQARTGKAVRNNPAHGPNELFDELVEHIQDLYPDFRCRLVCNNEKALAGRTEARAHAACSGTTVYVASKIYDTEYNRYAAILMHELAHAVLIQAGDEDHSEQDADDVAEELFGHRISYDREDVQTLGRGKYPRPEHLEQ